MLKTWKNLCVLNSRSEFLLRIVRKADGLIQVALKCKVFSPTSFVIKFGEKSRSALIIDELAGNAYI
ncbi:MAG: hypothetical protein COA96_13960 [SAR86 cluster bacterium]|uniref:Uncharacterized protein n=1 Tax=SAR86 cluster bacterium TaxID=2030880 RepID=A0A2A5ATM1_9GAMM|nr:MAG: hypothetical protein COA96_13960 [SAR86 cluster bacterium]